MKYFFLAILTSISFISASQCVSVPAEYVLEKAEDYSAEEENALKLIECLLLNPSEFSKEDFNAGIAYSIIWIGGTPDYRVEVETDVALFIEEEPNLLYPYILSLTLAHKEFQGASQIELETEAMNYLYLHYSSKSGYAKSKSLEKMQKKYDKGKLTEFLESLRNQN